MRLRQITVPKSEFSKSLLDYDKAEPHELIEYNLSESEFLLLWKGGIFDLLNTTANCLIDDFESESIENIEDLNKVVEKLNLVECQNSELERLVLMIQNMANEAINRKTGLYFFF